MSTTTLTCANCGKTVAATSHLGMPPGWYHFRRYDRPPQGTEYDLDFCSDSCVAEYARVVPEATP